MITPACRRYVAVTTDVFGHGLFDGDEYSRRDAWLWLVANAAWKDHRVRVGNTMVDIKRGQVVASRSYLAKEWKWGEKKVRLFLDLLVSEGMIEKGQQEGRLPVVVTICNYDRFQTGKAIEGQQDDQQRASKGPDEGQIGAGKGPHSTKDTKDTKDTNTVCHTPEPARANGQTDDPNFVKCKLALNGSTSRLIDEIRNSEGPYGTKARAAEWLADTLDDFGAAAVLDAFRFLEKCRGEGQTIRDPKGFMTKNAQRYVENQAAKKAAEAENKATRKKTFNRMTGQVMWVAA
jgi:hypothetical protein